MKKGSKTVKKTETCGEKTCVVTRQVFSRKEMLRFVVAPDGNLFFDVSCKLPGRGIWLVSDQRVLKEALTKHVFQKVTHRLVKSPENMEGIVVEQLKTKVLSLLGLCRRAGILEVGFDASKETVMQGQCVLAFESVDASNREHNRLFRKTDPFPVYTFFTREELGKALGMSTCVYVTVKESALTDDLRCMADKLIHFLNKTDKVKG